MSDDIQVSGVSTLAFIAREEERVNASVGAGRSPRRQMRRYLPRGERFVMSLSTVAKTKTRCFHNTYES